MKALILSAGEGTRLRPLTLTIPKVMAPIGGKPNLENLIRLLKQYGITEIYINLHYLPEVVTSYFGDGSAFGVSITYLQESELSGDAGPIQQLASNWTEPFLVVCGDSLTCIDFQALIKRHRASLGIATVVIVRDTDPESVRRRSCLELAADGTLKRFTEKPDQPYSDLVSGHIWVFEPRVLEYIPTGHSMIGSQLVPKLLAAGEKIASHLLTEQEYLVDFGTPERYQQVQQDFLTLGSRLTV